jgi:7,8-dihydropterin-6-yl-methyl-4-(beta-D-ribofuranosyl)aminobenzene 5'-phosphate synthase
MTVRDLRVTALVDNHAGEGLLFEHGLSLWIEAGGLRILFDTGQGGVLAENARKLEAPLEETDVLVLSHGHFDHAGGMAELLGMAPRARVFLHPGAVLERYSLHPGKPARSIGMPAAAREALERLPADRVVRVDRPLEIAPGIGVTGPVPRETAYEDAGGPFFLDPEGRQKDPIPDDQALWLRSPRGLVVAVGCGHAGLVNTLQHARRASGEPAVAAILGGFHLLQADAGRLGHTLDALDALSPGILAPGHCTGDAAVRALRDRFGDRVSPIEAGMTFRF